MKGTARALFTVATRHRMCYETICDHVHNRVVAFITELIAFITAQITFTIEVITCTT